MADAVRPGGETTMAETMKAEDQQDQHAPRVLIVDDDHNLREILQVRLEQEGCEVMLAADGREALDHIADMGLQHPDLIVLDLMMPGMSGLEVLETIKQDESTSYIPVIILTGDDSSSGVAAGIETGADFYWVKPFELADFIRTVKLVLEHKNV
jgi:DNA-binding response OmpR family regulator